MFIITFIKDVIVSAMSMLNSASPWILFSFAIAGVIHEFVGTDMMKKANLGSTKLSGILSMTLTGMALPICSCGTIPLGISMYYSGAYLGPVLTFMTSSPMINPIAIILSLGLLGPQITLIYVLMGFFCPMLIGIIANKLGGEELYYKPAYENKRIQLNLKKVKLPVAQRIKSGLRWSFTELAMAISKYTVSGMLIAGILFTVVPQGAIQRYLGDPGMVSLLGITVVAALMYVCAVGHIPFIAAVVASGAAPGVAITFLTAGCATNIAELISIRKTIGKRAVALYAVSVLALSQVGGILANKLLPDFQPVLDFDKVTNSISSANAFLIEFPEWIQTICSLVLIGYALVSLFKILKKAAKAHA